MSIARSASILSIGLAICAASASAAGPDPGINVTVTNPPTQPVPVTGSIGVSGGITINNPASAPVPVAGVVTNPASNPVLVRNVDKPARTGFQSRGSCAFGGANPGACSFDIQVPADKQLVIETISLELDITQGAGKPFAQIDTTQNGVRATFTLPVQPMATFNVRDFYNGLHTVRLYADRGTTVTVVGELSTGGSGGVQAAISGYLVDCGAGNAGPCPLP